MEQTDFTVETGKEKKHTVEEWLALPEGKYVELIDGVFYDKEYYMAPPSMHHEALVRELVKRIGNYIDEKGGDCEVFPAPFGVRLHAEDSNIVEPDITVVCDRDKLSEQGCTGAPDWVIEITSPSTASMDYVKKRELYTNAGVREYWIVDPNNRIVMIYKSDEPMRNESFTFEDTVKVGIYEDFSIDFKAITERILWK